MNAAFAAVLNSHGNGYVVISGYDLGSNQGGQVNTPAEYRSLVQKKIQETMTMASQHQVYYQFAIPAGASAHEFEAAERSFREEVDLHPARTCNCTLTGLNCGGGPILKCGGGALLPRGGRPARP